MVECSLSRRSKTRTEPSAETEAKTPASPHAMSCTALSCAMSCVSTTPRSMSQTVQVVSMEAVPMRRGSISFQSKEVRGAQNSEAEALRLSRTERSSGAGAEAERSSRGACQRRRASEEEARRGVEAARGLNWSLVGG
ncbi:hypothetical protein CFC21_084008 [Triticum aestivum]|uniref:Uncharacterized protein n=2 Tax=Triticum aestivum TaxID=4565 RepID=A0A9R1IA56_WHEAT|nr:hypothetical protein CFC21_084008 [Triticum aestivum]